MSIHAALQQARLYGILDLGYVALQDAATVARQMCAGGVDLLQLRAKGCDELDIEQLGREVAPICEDAGVPFIVNDYPELVPALGAAGAHVGQDDLPIAEARWRAGRALGDIGSTVLIGRSTHSLVQAEAAVAEGADYIGFGPLFLTGTKPGRPAIGLQDIEEVRRRVSIPIFCIGGIKLDNLDTVVRAGARRVVVVSGILQAQDMAGMCRELKARLAHLSLAE